MISRIPIVPHRRQLLRGAGAALLTFVLAACGSPPPVDLFLAELVPFGISGIDTDVIFPRREGASRFLIRNWPPMTTLEGNTVWVHGKWARIGFYAVADEPPTFVAEASPYSHPDAPAQVLTVSLNDQQLESVPMRPGWHTYEIDLPGELVDVGWNEIELAFAQSLRPADFDAESRDRRTLAAEFRRIEMRGAARRPYWDERPEHIELVTAKQSPGAAAAPAAGPTTPRSEAAAASEESSDDPPRPTLAVPDPGTTDFEMPADSFLETYVFPGAGVRLTGVVSASFDSDTAGVIRAVVDAIDPDAETLIWSAELSAASPTADVAADLSGWANRVVGLRLRVFGDTNGVVTWQRLGITQSAAPGELPASPHEVLAPPVSGALGRPDIFLIILDAARADVFEGDLGAELAPNVQALASEATTFSRAWAPSSWTGQTIPAVWSGMTPDAVGVQHWGSRLSPQVTTFPEVIHDAGYRTVLWSQHNIYRSRRPLRHGFEVFEETDSTDLEQRQILPAIADVVDDERPTLAVIHLLPPHAPYTPPEPFLGSRSGWYEGEPITAQMLNLFDSLYTEQQAELRDEIRRAAIAKYEENVRFADHLVGRLVDDLRQQGRYDDALVIVTSDHGEAFYEHGRFLHTKMLYEEFLRVPLVVKWPTSADGFLPVVDAPVSLIDLAPTLVDGLAIEDERARYQGRSLLPPARGEPPPTRVVYAYTSGETNPDWDPKPQYAVRAGDFKLIRDDRYDRIALHRLSTDPGETEDLSLREGFYAAWLTQVLRQTQAHNTGLLLALGGAATEDLDAETVRRLRALGYLR